MTVFATSPLSSQDTYNLDALQHEVQLSSVEVSPNGKQLVVVARRPDYDENRFVNQLYLVDVEDGDTRPLTFSRPNIQQPQWSPDGQQIAFLATGKNEKAQVFVMDMRGGESRDVTQFDTRVGWFCWAPNGRTLAFTAAAPSKDETGAPKHNKSFKVTRDSYLTGASAAIIHLWTVDVRSGKSKQLTFGTETVASPFGVPFDFSPDGQKLVYVARPAPEKDTSGT